MYNQQPAKFGQSGKKRKKGGAPKQRAQGNQQKPSKRDPAEPGDHFTFMWNNLLNLDLFCRYLHGYKFTPGIFLAYIAVTKVEALLYSIIMVKLVLFQNKIKL
jgi:hypothetical protein